MDTTVADPNAPDLGFRMVGEQALSSRQRILSHFKCAGLYINGHDLPLVAGFDLWTDVLGIDFIPTPCMFLFTIARLPHLHNFASQVGKEESKGFLLLLYRLCQFVRFSRALEDVP
jgi:hypothetical protein